MSLLLTGFCALILAQANSHLDRLDPEPGMAERLRVLVETWDPGGVPCEHFTVERFYRIRPGLSALAPSLLDMPGQDSWQARRARAFFGMDHSNGWLVICEYARDRCLPRAASNTSAPRQLWKLSICVNTSANSKLDS